MPVEKINQHFEEPGCATNRQKSEKERKAGCAKRLKPGAAAGGCAFDGAKIVLQPITDAAHLVHGPISCEGNSWDNRGAFSSGPKLYRTSFTTDLGELDIIYGGEKKLLGAIEEVVSKYRPPAVFVYQTCIPALIGDDIEAVCRIAREKHEIPVVPVHSPGYAGTKNFGNKLAGEALLDHVIGTVEPLRVTPYDINLIGEYNLVGERWQIEKLLKQIGVRVLSCMSGDARFNDIATAHRARISMLLCSKAMINVARKMEERYDIPYFEGSFYGISDTSDALRNIARLLVKQGAPKGLIRKTEELIAAEEERVWKEIEVYRERLKGTRLLLLTGGVKSWSIVSALKEIGIEIVMTSVKKSTSGDKERVKELLGEEAHTFEEMPPDKLDEILKSGKVDIMLSGGRTQYAALKAKVPWLDINQERHHPYAGYEGMLNLVREIDLTLHNPIWKQVQSRPPWEANAC